MSFRPFLWLAMPRKALQAAALLGDPKAAKVLQRMSDNFRNTIWVLGIGAMLTVGLFTLGHTIVDYHTATTAVESAQIEANSRDAVQRLKFAAELRQTWVRSCRVTPEQAESLIPVDLSGVSTPPPMPRKE